MDLPSPAIARRLDRRRATPTDGRSAFAPRRSPRLLRAGLLALGAGALLDAGHHAGVATMAGHHTAEAGHLVTLAGMLVSALAIASAVLWRR